MLATPPQPPVWPLPPADEAGRPLSRPRKIAQSVVSSLAIAWLIVSCGRFVFSWLMLGVYIGWSGNLWLLANEAMPSLTAGLLLWGAWKLVGIVKWWPLAVLPVSVVVGLLYLELTTLFGAGSYFFQLIRLFHPI